MHLSTREIVVNLILEMREGKKMKRKTFDLFMKDSFARNVFQEEKQKLDIEDYLDGELPIHEKEIFERKLSTQPELACETAFRGKVNQALRDMELIRILDEAHNSYLEQQAEEESILLQPIEKRTVFDQMYFIKWIAAACIIFLLGLSIDHYLTNRTSPEENLYARYYTPFKSDDHLMVNRTGIMEAEKKYREKDYYAALAILKNLPDNITIQAEKEFYTGLSYMETQSFFAAINTFSDLLENHKHSEYIPQAYWYLGLCYLNTRQTNGAVETFRHVVQYKTYNYKEAERILSRIARK